jgi:NAD-dependent SIR2 family protein deacetylase
MSIKIDFACKDCGKIAKPVGKKGNWDVMPKECQSCGGKLRPKVK